MRARRRCSHADLDAERLVRNIEGALLDLLVDLLGGVEERLQTASRATSVTLGRGASAHGLPRRSLLFSRTSQGIPGHARSQIAAPPRRSPGSQNSDVAISGQPQLKLCK